jgi:hypothetical protein
MLQEIELVINTLIIVRELIGTKHAILPALFMSLFILELYYLFP